MKVYIKRINFITAINKINKTYKIKFNDFYIILPENSGSKP